jgi:hypothetical protein
MKVQPHLGTAQFWRCHPDLNRGMKVLQTFALPLGYGTAPSPGGPAAIENGAVDETRTRDLHLGKVALYQLSYYREKWCLGAELNHRHVDFQSTALPTELPRHLAIRKGLEPSTSSVTGWHSNQLNYRTAYFGGNNRARTCDPLLVRQVLSQLSYAPTGFPARRVSRRHQIYYHRPYRLSIAPAKFSGICRAHQPM